MAAPQVEPLAVRLRDGTAGLVRPLDLEAAGREKDRLRDAYAGLSPDSRYQRFLAPVQALSPLMLHKLVDHVDGRDHVALVLDVETDRAAEPVAIGRYVRERQRPDHAEVAVTVVDAWQGRGAGALLVRVLADRALLAGVTHFTASVLADNEASLRMLAHGGALVGRELASHGVLDVLVELRPDPGPRRP